MANIEQETTGSSDLGKEIGDAGVVGPVVETLSTKVTTEEPPAVVVFSDKQDVGVTQHALLPQVSSVDSASIARPSVAHVPVGPSNFGSTSSHPKRFSAMNINKKFLEKASSTSSVSQSSATSVSSKSGGPIPRPATQNSTSHSRLVTTKLTATPQASTTGPGWSRPSSATPSVAPSPSSTPNANASSQAPPAAAPQLPHSGKVIQPQPRAVASGSQSGGSRSDGSGGSNKPAWGNVKASTAKWNVKVPNDFPTAAEVAQVNSSARKAKINDTKEAAEAAAAHKQARMEEADTFRGVHLDPNAHHWDEMEEDDDNFLDGVIEFGDGRQYKIQPAEATRQSSPPRPPPRTARDDGESSGDAPTEVLAMSAAPVSKEERFADDFDRSWPRSKTSPAVPPREFSHPRHQPVPPSPVSSHLHASPQEASRVLFNPYSNAHPSTNRSGPISHTPRRADFSTSPTGSRRPRDAAPHSQGANIHLLQKPGFGNDVPPRSRGNFGPPGALNNDRHRDREFSRRDPPPGTDFKRPKEPFDPFGVPPSPGFKDRDFTSGDNRGRRLSNMGPPPPRPASIRDRSKDSGRQLPPHMPSPNGPLLHRPPSREPNAQPHSLPTSSPSTANRALSQSPVLSRGAVATLSHSEIPVESSGVPVVDIEEVRKDVMQSAAARAKQRRQQEEEAREKEKERARRKADELAAKTKPREVEPPKLAESEVIEIIEEAVRSTSPQKLASETLSSNLRSPQSSTKASLGRLPSLKAVPRQAPDSRPPRQRRPSQSSATSPITPTPAVQAESWRSKTNNPPPLRQPPTSLRPPLIPPPSVLNQPASMDSLAALANEELEVVDFSELGKFVGVDETGAAPNTGVLSSPRRPVASDFFDDVPLAHDNAAPPLKSEIGPWRRSSTTEEADGHKHREERDLTNKDHSRTTSDAKVIAEGEISENSIVSSASFNKDSADHSAGSQTVVVSSIIGPQRTTRAPTLYREAAMSALDDVMSRIKGALDGMQAGEPPTEGQHHLLNVPHALPPKPSFMSTPMKTPSPNDSRWIPPPLRAPHPFDFDVQAHEVFDVTRCTPPHSPRPVWNTFTVRLPRVSAALEPLTKRQSNLLKGPPVHVRWDIMSFDPLAYEMRREFSFNDIFPQLRRPPPTYKGKHKYRVLLPKTKFLNGINTTTQGSSGPKVHLPANTVPLKHAAPGAFGRSTIADGLSTWRKPPPPAVKTEGTGTRTADPGLDTVSRSPPPDLPVSNSVGVAAIPKSDSSTSFNPDGVSIQRSRSQPKMPPGSAVAFYRNPRIDTVNANPQTLVNFIVSSELEDPPEAQLNGASSKLESHNGDEPVSVESDGKKIDSTTCELKSQPPSPEFVVPPLAQSKTESSDESTDRNPPTPPIHHTTATWTKSPLGFSVKELPARAPDPEHLKAVWSQASNKAGLPVMNSLEGIADDLTALPFTLQDVKSEDGETPPPSTSAAPSRMSLHDVTRAFQQVPSPSPGSSAHRSAPLSPASATNLPLTRQPNYTYALPTPPNSNMRPAYAAYGSPVVGHSPSPTLMYAPATLTPSSVPSRMPGNGHTPLYGQTMWIPSPGQASQNYNGMFRPLGPPYPAPYPNGTQLVYSPASPANLPNLPLQQNGAAQPRGRGMPVMSPGMAHVSHPNMQLYPGSPVLVHTPIMQTAPSHAYIPLPAGRGQVRNDHVPGQPMQQQTPTHLSSPHTTAYTPVPPASFVRPTW